MGDYYLPASLLAGADKQYTSPMSHPTPPVPRSKKIIYLDHAATTPVRPEVLRAMQPFWSKQFGNPSTLYALGRHARTAIAEAREQIAHVLGAQAREIIFTSGGTESDNLAILGAANAYRTQHRTGGHIIVSSIEHHAVQGPVLALKARGFTVTHVPVTNLGFVEHHALLQAIRPDTVIISIMYANNEIGSIQPIAELSRLLRKVNTERQQAGLPVIFFHTDACQAAGYLDVSVQTLGVDMLTLNSSKIYGPKQVGLLYVRQGIRLEPIMYGGGQEGGMRSGTENVAGIVGFARALTLAVAEQKKETRRLTALRDWFVHALTRQIPSCTIHGPSLPETSDTPQRLANNINISLGGCDGEALVIYLDAHGIAAATGSACATGNTEPSHVLQAIGLDPTQIRNSLRLTLGRETTKPDLVYTLKVLKYLVAQQRSTTTML